MKSLKIIATVAMALSLSTMAFAGPDFLDPNADPAVLSELAGTLSPAERETVAGQIRFEMLHESRADLASRLELLQAARAAAPLTRDNLLGIPLRIGTLELKVMFMKKRGAILRCDRQGVIATLDTYRVEAIPDLKNPGKVIAKFSGDPTLPAQPIGGVIKTRGDVASIIGDDGTTLEVTWKTDGTYSFKTNKFPAAITGRYID